MTFIEFKATNGEVVLINANKVIYAHPDPFNDKKNNPRTTLVCNGGVILTVEGDYIWVKSRLLLAT